MRLTNVGIICLIGILLPAQSMALTDSGVIEADGNGGQEIEMLQGIIFDRTITQTGLNFYQEFSRLWQDETTSHHHALGIRETPTARQGSIIWIEEGNNLLHKLVIGMRDKDATDEAMKSLQAVQAKLGNTSTNGSELLF